MEEISTEQTCDPICREGKDTKLTELGITLIALVITIVVLIILATISINYIIGDDGIILRAEKAKEYQLNAEAYDQKKMEEFINVIEENINGDPTKDWDPSKVDKVTSEDGEYVPVPKGYVASTIKGEKSVNTGFVIKEGTNGNATQGINEFVWIPVRNISDIYDEINNAGQLWNFGTNEQPKNPAEKIKYPEKLNDGSREPDVITYANEGINSSSGSQYDAVSDNLQQAGLSSTATAADFKVQLQNEFNNMIESVKKYKGFYIGRYETGNLSKAKAVVQKGNTDIINNKQTWYTLYKMNKTVGANQNVTASMIWGCQWDATLRWMQNEGVTDKIKNFSTNSGSYGNYLDNSISYVDADGTTKTTTIGIETIIPTGSAEIAKVNNIYDIAGNVWDWTIEAYEASTRVRRGGNYKNNSIETPSSIRRYDKPVDSGIHYGSRSTIFITI